MIRIVVIFISITLAFYEAVYSQVNQPLGIPHIAYYSSLDYHAGMQNYAITQDNRGLIYFANNLSLVEFDGVNWNTFSPINGTKVRSVHIDGNGKIFIGAQNEIGYFVPDPSGQFRYITLNNLIPDQFRNFEDVWKIYSTNNGLVFITSRQMMRLENHQIEVVKLPDNFISSFYHKGKIIGDFAAEGLKIYKDGKWITEFFSEPFKNLQTSGIISFTDQYDLVSTLESGLYIIDSYSVKPFAEELLPIFKQHNINAILHLRNGLIAIATNTDGLYILNMEGKVIKHLSKDSGLKSRTVLAVYEDFGGNIWLGLDNGITMIEWQSPFSYLDEYMNLPGTGYTALLDNKRLYLGTNNGLFYLDIDDQRKNGIETIENVTGQIYNIQKINGQIFVSGHFGAWLLENNTWLQISDITGWWTFIPTQNPNLLIGGNYNGLFLWENKDNTWTIKLKYPSFEESSRVMQFDENGLLWMTHGYKGVYRFDLTDDYERITDFYFYNQENGFPSNVLINVFNIENGLVFTSERGHYHYESESDSFVPHEILNKLLGADVHTRFLTQDILGNIHFITQDFTGKLRKNARGKFEKSTDVFNGIHVLHNDDLERISMIGDKGVMFSSKQGFIHYNNFTISQPNDELSLLIRGVNLPKTDSLIFDGTFYHNESVVTSQPEDAIYELPYRHNSISIVFSAVDFQSGEMNYKTLLEGYNDKWTSWTTSNEVNYTHLPEGEYIFKVQARNIYHQFSNIATYRFSISPPWYRSNIAYFFYFLAAIGIIFLTALIYKIKHQREKNVLIKKQEEELKIKESKLQKVSKESQAAIDHLRNEKLKLEVSHKTSDLVNSTMHIIEINNSMSSMKHRIIELSKKESDSEIQRELKKIINEIDRNLTNKEDWSQFEILFDEVYVGFLNDLRNDYPNLTAQEIKLSAYLKMGMRTKEIANLLKISIRGVEIARYRLRKKLKIERGVNLVDFMLKYSAPSRVVETKVD